MTPRISVAARSNQTRIGEIVMRTGTGLLCLFLFALCAAGANAQTKVLPAADIPAAQIETLAGPSRPANTLPNVRVVDAGGHNIGVGVLYRTESQVQPAALHYKVSEVYHIMKGSATFVTGGKMINSKVRPEDSPQVKQQDGPGETGTAIEGGVSRQVKEGDVIIIPAGTPHWFSKINGSLAYLVIRVDPNQIITLQ
jgi:mannose-6-phosphate isomerase-like protein (cupin superfamily)